MDCRRPLISHIFSAKAKRSAYKETKRNDNAIQRTAHPTSQSFTLSRLPLSLSRLRLSLSLAAQPVKSLGCSHDSSLVKMSLLCQRQAQPRSPALLERKPGSDEARRRSILYLPYSNIPHSLPFRLQICAARASIRLRPSPPPPASASVCGTRPIRRHPHTRPLRPSFKHCVCRAAIGGGRGGGGVWNRFPLSLAQRSAGENVQRREGERGEYPRQVSVRYSEHRCTRLMSRPRPMRSR
jgi:hypothetical protein